MKISCSIITNDNEKLIIAVSHFRLSLPKCMKDRSSDPAEKSANVWDVFTWELS